MIVRMNLTEVAVRLASVTIKMEKMAGTGENPFKTRGVDYQPALGMGTLPAKYYRSPDIFAKETEQIYSRHWQVACRVEQIPMPGDFLTVTIGFESVIIVRDQANRIRAHLNVCRHRGTRLCATTTGSFGKQRIRCPYHSWSYDLDGRLVSAPQMQDSPDFQLDRFGLYAVHVELWEGFVFVNLAECPIPFETQMQALLGKFAAWNMAELREADRRHYSLACNWKLILQNYQECYHCPGVHPLLSQRTPPRDSAHDCFAGPVIGGYMTMNPHQGQMTLDGEPPGEALPGVQGEDAQRVYYYSVFPNLLLSPHPQFVLYHLLQPLAVDRTEVTCVFLLPNESIADAEKMRRFQSTVEFWDRTNREDWHVCQEMQIGMNSRRFEQGIYAAQEDMLWALDEEYRRLMEPDQDSDINRKDFGK